MKVCRCLRRFGLLTLFGVIAGVACSQEPKKPEIATSVNAQTVYKPLEQTAADKDKVVKEKNAASTAASPKQVAGKGKAQAQGKEKAEEKAKGKVQAQDKKENRGEKVVKDEKVVKGEKQTQVKGKKQAEKPAPSAEAKAASKRTAQAKGKQQQQKKQPQQKEQSKQQPNKKPQQGKQQQNKQQSNKKQQPKKKAPQKDENRRYIALKTNVPFQALSMHNLSVEVQVHEHVTVDFPVTWSISDIEREHAIRGMAFQPEGRWWLDSVGTGHFFGVHFHAAWFNMKWEENRYQTEHRPLLGAGISYGYKLPISTHWGAEFNLGAGYANVKYNTYYNIENGAMLNKRIRHYWGITRAGISLVYRF